MSVAFLVLLISWYLSLQCKQREADSFFAERYDSALTAVCSLFIYFYWLNITGVLGDCKAEKNQQQYQCLKKTEDIDWKYVIDWD